MSNGAFPLAWKSKETQVGLEYVLLNIIYFLQSFFSFGHVIFFWMRVDKDES